MEPPNIAKAKQAKALGWRSNTASGVLTSADEVKVDARRASHVQPTWSLSCAVRTPLSVITPQTKKRRPAGRRKIVGAGDGTRTRECELGKLVPYHLATPALVVIIPIRPIDASRLAGELGLLHHGNGEPGSLVGTIERARVDHVYSVFGQKVFYFLRFRT